MDESKTPMAIANEDTRPIAASPFNLFFSLSFKISIEARVTKGIDTKIGDLFRSNAIATVAKLTWAKPSPIIEYFLSTKNIPKKEEHKAISIPATTAFTIKLY